MRLILLLAIIVIIKFIICVTSAAPVESESGGISNIFQEQIPNNDYLSKSYKNVDDYETYRKKKAEQGFTSLCWTESLIITEDKRSKSKNMSKAYSIILESMANPGENIGENKNTSCYKIEGDDDIKRERIFNFTTVKETDVYSIKEHKTLFCGAGPVLSEHFIVWPKLNRKRIEISISPMTSTKWRACEENMVEESDRLGSVVSLEDSNVLENSEESKSAIVEPPMDSTYDSNNPSFSDMTEPSSAGISQNIDDSSVLKSPVDTENSSTGSKETIVNLTSNGTITSDWTESETVRLGKGKENLGNGSKSSRQLPNDTIVKNLTKEVSEAGQSELKVTQNTKYSDGGKSVDALDLPVGPKKKSKVTKKDTDTVNKEKITKASTTENSMEISDIQEKKVAWELKNSLLNRNSNCSSRNSSICNEIITKSSLIAEFQNTSSATLANLFFPNNTLLNIFRFADNRSYYLNAKVVLELKMSDSKSKIEDEKGAYLVLEEESKYLILKHRV